MVPKIFLVFYGFMDLKGFTSESANINGLKDDNFDNSTSTKSKAMDLEKNMVQKDTCTPTFTAALFIIAKTWKQRKCLLTDEWIKKMW